MSIDKPSYSSAMLSVGMNSSLIIGMATMLTLVLVAAMTTTTTAAYATTQNPRTDDPNRAGEVTSRATQDYRDAGDPSGFGGHASDPTGDGPSTPTDDQGRKGLANALTERGEPQHPSEVIETICGLPGDAPGCP